MGLSSHQPNNSKTTEWLTPPEILKALGPFDLDPCAPIDRPWDMAKEHYTIEDDGLSKPWHGRVWLNPPFNRYQVSNWVRMLAHHGNGTLLIPARTETQMFHDFVWGKAHSVLFLKGRPHFHRIDGSRGEANSGAPICLASYSYYDFLKLGSYGNGIHIRLRDKHGQWIAAF